MRGREDVKSVIVLAVCLLWGYRLSRVFRKLEPGGRGLVWRLWVENSLAVAVLLAIAAGDTRHPLWLAACILVVSAAVLGAVVTGLMWFQGVKGVGRR